MATLGLAACAAGSVRYAGTLSAEQGNCGIGFDAGGKAAATLVVQGTDARFAPTDGVTVLDGHISPSGHVTASSVAEGADHKPFQQVFEGDRTGDRVVGRFASPRCRAAAVLNLR